METDLGGNANEQYVFFGGQRVARRDVTSSGSTVAIHFYFSDYLGTHGVVQNATGSTCEQDIDFYPYGGAQSDYCPTATQNYKFTGKERDTETALDYFGARHLGPSMGRWMSLDPSNLGADVHLPQSWNRYGYAVNNPLTIKDANGMWPFYIHNEIIDESFPGMSSQDLQGLKDASWNMDFSKGQQDPTLSYEHGMRDGVTNQDPIIAQQLGDDYVSQQVQTAQTAQAAWIAEGHTGIAPGALNAFGNALHTVTDRTSPSHRGNQPWRNEPWYKKSTRDHVQGELMINRSDMNLARDAAQQLFHRVFGTQFEWMLVEHKKQACVTWSDTATGQSGGGCEKQIKHFSWNGWWRPRNPDIGDPTNLTAIGNVGNRRNATRLVLSSRPWHSRGTSNNR